MLCETLTQLHCLQKQHSDVVKYLIEKDDRFGAASPGECERAEEEFRLP